MCGFCSPISYIALSTPNESGTWVRRLRSTNVPGVVAKWPEMRIRISTLCGEDYHRPLRLDVYEQGWMSERITQRAQFNLYQLLEEGITKLKAKDPDD